MLDLVLDAFVAAPAGARSWLRLVGLFSRDAPAPLLGFNGLVFKAHGSARERAVTSAIRVTANAVKTQINQTIARDIAAANLILNAETPLPNP